MRSKTQSRLLKKKKSSKLAKSVEIQNNLKTAAPKCIVFERLANELILEVILMESLIINETYFSISLEKAFMLKVIAIAELFIADDMVLNIFSQFMLQDANTMIYKIVNRQGSG